MKLKGLVAELVEAVVQHEKNKVKTSKPDYYLNQKKQLWYRMMNEIDGDEAGADESGEEKTR